MLQPNLLGQHSLCLATKEERRSVHDIGQSFLAGADPEIVERAGGPKPAILERGARICQIWKGGLGTGNYFW